MMLHSLCPLLLLLFLTGEDVALAKASDNAISCAYDTCCKAMAKLLTAFSELSEKQDEQAVYVREKLGKQEKDLEELKANLNKNLASTAAVSTQLEKHSTDLLSHDDQLKAHAAKENNTYRLVQSECVAQPLPTDCSDIRKGGSSVSGVYRVYPGTLEKRREMDIYCDFSSVGQSWLVFQRRKDGSVKFERNWAEYANGFGDLTGEFWLGNEKLSLLTMNRKYKLRIELEDFTGQKRFAEYSTFSVKPATDKYRLTVGGFSGNAGDSMAYHNGMQFTTYDSDNDAWIPKNSAVVYHGAWWYAYGHQSNLNGLYLRGRHASYADGVGWNSWHGFYYSLKTTEMKIAAVI